MLLTNLDCIQVAVWAGYVNLHADLPGFLLLNGPDSLLALIGLSWISIR